MTEQSTPSATSSARVWKSTAAALLIALLVLAVLVWPVQRSPAPNESSAAVEDAAEPAQETGFDELDAIMRGNTVPAEPGQQVSRDQPFKSETVLISLASLEEVEFKAHMQPQDTLVYSWTSPEPLYVDLHGEPFTYPEEAVVQYEEVDGAGSGHGRVTATFPGMHGWYWLNISDSPVVIELKVSGYYDRLEEVYRGSQAE